MHTNAHTAYLSHSGIRGGSLTHKTGAECFILVRKNETRSTYDRRKIATGRDNQGV